MKNPKVLVLLALVVLAAIYYLMFVRVSRAKALNLIRGRDKSYESLDSAYVIAWGKAVKSKAPSFEHQGKAYVTATGKAA